MKQFRVIPAMDLMEGQCVRLMRGDFGSKTAYSINPVELAKKILDTGLDIIHVIDLDGAREGKPMNLKTVKLLAETGIHIELGGGLRTAEAIHQAVDSGAEEVIIGSSLLKSEEYLKELSERFPGILIAGIDARRGKVAINGWKTDTLLSATSIISKVNSLGLFSRLIYTDIARDGTLSGPNLKQLIKISKMTSLPIIASGGICSLQDIAAIKDLEDIGIKGVIVGKAFYENKITLEDMTKC